MGRSGGVIDDLERLKRQTPKLKGSLDAPAVREELPAGTGRGYASAASKSGGGGGIAFPLTEQTDGRAYYADRYLYSTDGLFTIAWAPIKTATFKDNSGSQGQVNYIDPDA